MRHLVIFITEDGVCSAVYTFKHVPPTIEDIKFMQEDMRISNNFIQTPAAVNWLPISDD